MLDQGYSFEEIARVLLTDDSTIRRWYNVYQSNGIEAMFREFYIGSAGKLSLKQTQALGKHLQGTVYMTTKEVCKYVEAKYGVHFTTKGMTNILHRLGFTYRKPKHIPGKADSTAQEAFIESYLKLKQRKDPDDRIYFVDGVHPLHNSQPAYGWLKKGFDYTIQSNTGRSRVNINGAYNLQDHTVIIEESPSINAQSTVALFKKILKEQPKGMIYIILDNAKYYRSHMVQEFLQDHANIQLMFLPPYSPNLNIIERLWKFFKKKVTYNTYYEQFSFFRRCCIAFFKNIQKYNDELRTLMTDNFHVIQA